MRAQGGTTPYEVHCPRCQVTFPVGARHCVHCGGRLSRERGRLPVLEMSFEEGTEPAEEEGPRRSPISPIAVIWVLLLVGGTLYRACTGG